MRVISSVACPSSFCRVRMFPPRIMKCDANVCRSQCHGRLMARTPAAFVTSAIPSMSHVMPMFPSLPLNSVGHREVV
jgi:hypothetical protein